MGKVNREGSRKRRASYRTPATQLLVVCGSELTEQQYLDGLKQSQNNRAVSVKVVNKPCSPKQLVTYAADISGRKDYDEVWCVFDVDYYHDVEEAIRIAKRQRISVAISNPCFELWLLLHLTQHTAHVATCQDVIRLLRSKLPSYRKNDLRFGDFEHGIADACKRGKALDSAADATVPNPSSGVWKLVEKISNGG